MGWLEHMPAMAIPRAVPYIRTYSGGEPSSRFTAIRLRALDEVDNDKWSDRVGLDDPQGFGFALRAYFQAKTSAQRNSLPDWSAITNRHLHGKTTEDDKVALAVSCKEAF